MKKLCLLMFGLGVFLLLVGCALQKDVEQDATIPSVEEMEVDQTLDELNELDTLSEGVDDVTFEELEELDLE